MGNTHFMNPFNKLKNSNKPYEPKRIKDMLS